MKEIQNFTLKKKTLTKIVPPVCNLSGFNKTLCTK